MNKSGAIVLIEAGGLASPGGVFAAPGAILAQRTGRGARILAAGRVADVLTHAAAAGAERTVLPHSILMPAFVNAHTHLDLTHIGPVPHDPGRGFVAWVDRVRERRAMGEESIRASVERGIALCRRGGTVAIGDIAGAVRNQPSFAPGEAMAASGMAGVSFLEFFAIGRGEHALEPWLEQARTRLEAGAPGGEVRWGLQPHAPYSVGVGAYIKAAEFAREHRLPLATHLAETPEEQRFIERGDGPQRDFLERLGLWDESLLTRIGHGRSPVEHLAHVLAVETGQPKVVAHVNHASDKDIGILACLGVSVAYCPRASAYFGADRVFGPHRYRDMLAAGINVALGTDSILNLPGSDVEAGGISVLDEMRLLHVRDGMDPMVLLQMGTVNGARALGLDPGWFRLEAGSEVWDIVAVEVEGSVTLRSVLTGRNKPRLLFNQNLCCLTRQ